MINSNKLVYTSCLTSCRTTCQRFLGHYKISEKDKNIIELLPIENQKNFRKFNGSMPKRQRNWHVGKKSKKPNKKKRCSNKEIDPYINLK